ncbi:MAG TPA: hypothetical protein VN377_01635 [Candidatus Thermoplasmatota archaeon]|nr:hypothetical protein [Candidatus Thermoplasmatota archaeon]
MKHIRIIPLYIAFSSIAAVLLIFIVGTISSQASPLSVSEKIGIASVFILCCVIGISFTVRPNWTRRYFHKVKNEEKDTQSLRQRFFRGHHPDCLAFQNHTIYWRKKTWCAGCLGLFIGLCASIILMILYLRTDFQPTRMISLALLLIGLFILAVVYIEILHRSKRATVHVFINSLLPLSFLSITIAVGGATREFIYCLFSILLCFLWLDTRVQLSKSHHRSLCRNCVESCKMFTASV